MKAILAKILLLTAILILLSGCIIVINQPSAEEKALVDVQNGVGKEVKSLNDKILSGKYDYTQLQSYLAEAQVYLENAGKKLNDLKIPEKAKAAYEKTKSYLESLNRNYQQLKQLFSDMEALKQKGAELTAAAKAEIDKQIKNLKNTINEVGSQLNRYAQSLQKLGADLMAQYTQQTKK